MTYGIAVLTVAVTVTFSVASFGTEAPRPRNFISGLGSDANPCTRTQPCKTLAQAISVTESGGEVIALDSAEYGPGPITISQPITITAPPGVDAQITATSGSAITINYPGYVALIGLNLVGNGGTTGVNINIESATVLFLDGSIVGFTTMGIGDTTASFGALVVQNSLIVNGSLAGTGIASLAGSLAVRNVLVMDCQTAVSATATSGSSAVSDSLIFNNETGVEDGPGAAITITNSHFQANGTGVSVNSAVGSVVCTTQDNVFTGNFTDVSGSLTAVAKK